jgi:hypothetical protein
VTSCRHDERNSASLCSDEIDGSIGAFRDRQHTESSWRSGTLTTPEPAKGSTLNTYHFGAAFAPYFLAILGNRLKTGGMPVGLQLACRLSTVGTGSPTGFFSPESTHSVFTHTPPSRLAYSSKSPRLRPRAECPTRARRFSALNASMAPRCRDGKASRLNSQYVEF